MTRKWFAAALCACSSAAFAGPMEILQSAASEYTGGVLVSDTLWDETTSVVVAIDPYHGYVTVELKNDIVAARIS